MIPRILILAVALLSGCATTTRPVSNDQTRSAMAYAERVIGRPAPVPAEWHLWPGEYERDGIWYHTGAAARSQYMARKTRIVVYTGPHGQQHQDVYRHEAAHAILRQMRHDPRWSKYFRNWKDQ